jgi:hypothetical protein
LTAVVRSRYTEVMAQSFLIFDFGTNEEAAQQARHTLDRWKQAFRLDKRLQLKFDRKEAEQPDGPGAHEEKSERILMFVRLDFSDHERLSHHRWLERIPAEAHFRDAQPKIIRDGDADFASTAERFDALD